MKRRWLTILSLMISIAAVAVVLAAIRKPSVVWASLLFDLSLGLNFLAVVAAIVGRGRTRAAGLGFALCGWGYFALKLGGFGYSGEFGRFRSAPFMGEVIAVLIWNFFVQDKVDEPEATKFYLWTMESIIGIAAGWAGAVFAWFLTRRPADSARPINSTTGQP